MPLPAAWRREKNQRNRIRKGAPEHSDAVDLPKRKDPRVFYARPLAVGSFSICNLVPKEYPTPAAGRLLLASPQTFSNASRPALTKTAKPREFST
jgi:hypothetical protein